MTNQNPDRRLEDLLRRALVPKGYRPTNDADIEKLLDTIGAEQLSEEKKRRMLQKIKGEVPVFPDDSAAPPVNTAELTKQERELVKLYRAQKKALPPELDARVKAMEERAAKKRKPGEESAGG